jgi:hypothetical protein
VEKPENTGVSLVSRFVELTLGWKVLPGNSGLLYRELASDFILQGMSSELRGNSVLRADTAEEVVRCHFDKAPSAAEAENYGRSGWAG